MPPPPPVTSATLPSRIPGLIPSGILPSCRFTRRIARRKVSRHNARTHRHIGRHFAVERRSMTEDWAKISGDVERLLKLRSLVFGMKLFEKREEMDAIPRIR